MDDPEGLSIPGILQPSLEEEEVCIPCQGPDQLVLQLQPLGRLPAETTPGPLSEPFLTRSDAPAFPDSSSSESTCPVSRHLITLLLANVKTNDELVSVD